MSTTCTIYTDPASRDAWAVVEQWGEREADTNAQECTPLRAAGPLGREELLALAISGTTLHLTWADDVPEGYEDWDRGETVWSDEGAEDALEAYRCAI